MNTKTNMNTTTNGNTNPAMNYEQAVEWIHSIGRFGIKPGLQRMAAFMEMMGNPHHALKVIHIGGTNGKGSTASFLSSVLQAAGLRVGLYTSPYLNVFNNRISINNEDITRAELVEEVNNIAPLVRQLADDPDLGQATEFEVVTAMALNYYARKKPDVLILEVGLGGRLDATNVVTPLISVITNISLEHTEILGDTPEKVAREKAGIIKQSAPVVTAVAEGGAREVIYRAARAMNAPVRQVVPFPDSSGSPGNSGNPGNPGRFGNYGNSGNPGNPGSYGNPGSPGNSGNPNNPGNPGNEETINQFLNQYRERVTQLYEKVGQSGPGDFFPGDGIKTTVGKGVQLSAYCRESITPDGQLMYYRGDGGLAAGQLFIPLRGSYQVANAATALAVLECLAENLISSGGRPALPFPNSRLLHEDTIRSGLRDTKWPGRLETVRTNPPIILDGAHNPAAMRSLAAAIPEYFPYRRLILVLGIMEDKDIPGIISEIVPLASEVILTRPELPRAATPEHLHRLAAPLARGPVEKTPDVPAALQAATRKAGPEDLILITGSLYTVSEARKLTR